MPKCTVISTMVRFWRSKHQNPLIWGRGIDFWCRNTASMSMHQGSFTICTAVQIYMHMYCNIYNWLKLDNPNFLISFSPPALTSMQRRFRKIYFLGVHHFVALLRPLKTPCALNVKSCIYTHIDTYINVILTLIRISMCFTKWLVATTSAVEKWVVKMSKWVKIMCKCNVNVNVM